MRAFIVLCFVAAACADKLGYNYQPVGHSDEGLSFAPGSIGGASVGGSSFDGSHLGSGSLGGVSSFGGSHLGGASLGGSSLGSGSFVDSTHGGSSLGSGSFGDSSLGGSSLGSGSFGSDGSAGLSAGHGSELNKEFYSFTAPEHEFDDGGAVQEIANSLKKNLRVIFIKGPENKGLENAALSLAKHAADQKTAIYVLNKQTDIGDLANRLNNNVNNNHQKPEVHFVKYRTPEDAANAQHAIQSQYDQLGGSSQSHNGGVAPVLNFASPAQVHAAAPHAPGNAYLPASIFHRRT